MNFICIDSIGIQTDLIALQTTSQPFTIHLYQHQGLFEASGTRIGNKNDAFSQFAYFFQQAKAKNSDLVLTPEYSCPWKNILEIVNNEQLWPSTGKLWALGCESISKVELEKFQKDSSKQNVFAHWEQEDKASSKNFYDPLVYLFKGAHQGIEKLIVLVQFKTMHMGAWFSALERDHLIEGSIIWILKNQAQSHRFISIICSEAMNFSDKLTEQKMAAIGWHENAYYIYHPQANPDPTHSEFVHFRKFILGADRKELIALNWNTGTTYKGVKFIENGTSRSGIYTQSTELDLREPRIKKNHVNGLYYYSFGIKNHAFLFNSSSCIFLMSLTRIIIIGAAAPQARRDGPLVQEVENYDAQSGSFFSSLNNVSDNHIPFLTSLSCGCNFMTQADNCILEKERFVCLTCGQLKAGISVKDLKSLLTLNMKQDTESNLRVTVEDDLRHESQGVKSGYIDSINIIIHDIIPKKDLYPESIIDLRNDQITIGFSQESKAENYKHNVLKQNGDSARATIIYMNSLATDYIRKIFDNVQSLFDSHNPNKRRVVIFYRRGANIKSWSDPKAGNIAHTDEKDGPNILNTQL